MNREQQSRKTTRKTGRIVLIREGELVGTREEPLRLRVRSVRQPAEPRAVRA